MNSSAGLRFLRPYLSKDVPITKKSIYVRFFNTAMRYPAKNTDPVPWAGYRKGYKLERSGLLKKKGKAKSDLKDRAPVELRIKELEIEEELKYPDRKSVV